jgi:ketosteroid isomerase-like protein
MSHPNADLIARLYGAMDKHDGDTMAACYAPDAHFHDPVFGDLTGTQAGAMWKMLTARSEDLRVELPEHAADDATGTAHWIATYTFGDTGRKVVNDIRATFAFRDGLIVRHVDDFSFWTWSRQALGLPGVLLGWTPLLRRKVSSGALERLRAEPGGA